MSAESPFTEVEGYVWCDVHGMIHESLAALDPFIDEECVTLAAPEDHRPVFIVREVTP